jgi:integrase
MNNKRRQYHTGALYQRPGSQIWWIKYHRNGKPFRESTKQTIEGKAARMLQSRLDEITKETFIEPKNRKLTVSDFYDSLLTNYRINGKASLKGAEQRWAKRLQAHFGHVRASYVSSTMLDRYVEWCLAQGLSNATINRDLSALRRAFYLAVKAKRIQQVPSFPDRLTESSPRSGFVEQAQYDQLRKHARVLWLRALIETAYTFGFRKGELLKLKVGQVNLPDRTIRLNPGETKNKKGRLVVMTDDVYVLLEAAVSGKKAEGYVFTRKDGNPIRDFREVWSDLCREAGLGQLFCPTCSSDERGIQVALDENDYCSECRKKPIHRKYTGLLFHDLRRSAVRNMIRRGVPQRVARDISGHLTDAVFDRYNITNQTDLIEAARKIESGKANQNWAQIGHSAPVLKQTTATASLPPKAVN